MRVGDLDAQVFSCAPSCASVRLVRAHDGLVASRSQRSEMNALADDKPCLDRRDIHLRYAGGGPEWPTVRAMPSVYFQASVDTILAAVEDQSSG